MPKRTPAVAAIGRVQAERPPAPQETARQADGPRQMHAALLVPIEQIVPDRHQPRRDMNTDRLAELAASLKEYGVLQPLLVREDGLLDDGRVRYHIVAGGRRYAAAQQAGLVRLPVVVRDSQGATLRLTQLVENVQRQDLAPMDEARAFKELMDAEEINTEQLGARLGISGQKVRDRLLLLTDQVVSDAVQREQIPVTVAAEILRLPDEGKQQLRAHIDAGASPDRTTVRKVRDEMKAAGVTNPRAKGGGRPKRLPQDVPQASAEGDNYQCGIDSQGVTHAISTPNMPRVAPIDDLGAVVGTRDTATASTSGRGHVLYSAFQDWRARVYGEIDSLTSDERETLARLLRADIAQLLQRIDAV